MVELGQLEERHADFDKVRVVAISQDDLENSKRTQEACPHLQIVSDANASIANALELMDKVHHGPKGEDTNAPTTILVDGAGNPKKIVEQPSVRRDLQSFNGGTPLLDDFFKIFSVYDVFLRVVACCAHNHDAFASCLF